MLADALVNAFRYLVLVLTVITLAILLVEVLMEMGWIARAGFLAAPLIKFAHLHPECEVSFITAFGSPTASNSILARLYDTGIIDKNELVIASQINSFPSSVVIMRSLVPVLIPLLGRAALIYLGIIFLVGLLRTVLVLLVGRLILEEKPYRHVKSSSSGLSFQEALRRSWRESRAILKRIVVNIVPVTLVVFILIDLGFFDFLAGYVEGYAGSLPVPSEAMPILAAWFASNIAAYTVAGSLYNQGVLTVKEVVVTLLLGRILSSITRVRTEIPFYLGIYEYRIGFELMAISIFLRNGVLLVVTVLLILFW